MSRRNKATKDKGKKREGHAGRDKLFTDVVHDTTAVFTCSTDIANDFVHQCDRRLEDVQDDIGFTRTGLMLWKGHAGRAELAAALADLLAEQQRHLDVSAALLRRFEALAADQSHEHLDPPEAHWDRVHRSLFPNEPLPPS